MALIAAPKENFFKSILWLFEKGYKVEAVYKNCEMMIRITDDRITRLIDFDKYFEIV